MIESPYVADKNLSDLSASWRVQFGKRHYVDVFIWESQKGLFMNTGFTEKLYAGAYIAFPGRGKTGLFGEIHLLLNMIGAGYVAHELMHLIYDWMSDRDMKEFTSGLCLNERTAYLMSDVTTDFWDKFYNFYDVASSKDGDIVSQEAV